MVIETIQNMRGALSKLRDVTDTITQLPPDRLVTVQEIMDLLAEARSLAGIEDAHADAAMLRPAWNALTMAELLGECSRDASEDIRPRIRRALEEAAALYGMTFREDQRYYLDKAPKS